jgi:hypothetical protein
MQRITPGTVIDENARDGEQRLVLLAKSRLASGDVDETSRMVRDYAGMFHLAILAHVVSEQNGGTTRYRLARVAVGLCLPIKGRNVVISSSTHSRLGAGLNFIAKRVLAGGEENLDDVVQIARHPAISIFDAKAIVLHDGEHRDMVVRHMVWVNPQSGTLGTLVWQLAENAKGYRMAQSVMQVLPPSFVEDRIVNVKSSELTFGVPSERAFAIVDIPQGTPIPVTPELARLAARRSFSAATLSQLAEQVNKAIAQKRARSQSE